MDQYKYSNYLRRAEECFRVAKHAFDEHNFDACVINCVHSAIAASDAICVYHLKKRSASDDHRVAPWLLQQIDRDCAEQAIRLSRLIGLKSASEYGEVNMTEKDAQQAKLDAERFLHFAKSKLPPS
ncbi:MAG: HEPN domain-containing protein [Candidatus Micrarchaeota archaeon]